MYIYLSTMISSWKKGLSIVLLVLTTVLWGSSFIITKSLTHTLPIFLYLTLRFSIAIIGFFPYFLHFKQIDKKSIFGGFLTGLIYFISIVFQTIGIQTTSAGKAAFITALGTIMVPFIAWIGFKKKINIRIWIALPFCFIGTSLLLLEGESGIAIGDFLVLACAFSYAVFILFNDKYVHLVDVYVFSVFQLITISFSSFLMSLIFKETFNFATVDYTFWLVIIYMGIAVTTCTFLFQNWSQQHQGPSETAIIFTLEPVFAVLFASFILSNETMTLFGWIGCLLIFIALLIAVLKKNKEKITKLDN
jgi:drug/metabolite transporter (DMT)-like permease